MQLQLVLGNPIDCFLGGACDEFTDDDVLGVVIDVFEEDALHQSPRASVGRGREHTSHH